MDQKNIVQMHAVIFKRDSVSNMMRTLDNIHLEEGWNSHLIADLFSEYDDAAVLASADYDKTPLLARLSYLASRFMRLDNKAKWLQEYLTAKQRYRPGQAKELLEAADIRIWHFGAFYTLFRYFHAGDILFYHGITYPYLSYYTEFGIYSKNMLQAIQDMNPFIIVHTQFIKQSLIDLGFRESSIHLLPCYHKYSLPYQKKYPQRTKLVAWGRYAMNKGIPELVAAANKHKLRLRVFGDNNQIREFSDQYKEAVKANTEGYATLSAKVPEFDAELEQANIYVCNSYHEGFNAPLIEAEAHSLPVLARRGTAMDELVREGYNGFLFSDVDEIPELAAKILKDYRRFSRNAWKHSRGFTYGKFKQRYIKILKEYEAFTCISR